MSNNKKKSQVPMQRPAATPMLPAGATEMTQTPVGAMLKQSIDDGMDFSAHIRQGSKELDLSYDPPRDGDGVTTKREINLRFRDK